MFKKEPLVSIVIANFNGKNLLKKCLDALSKTDYPSKKIEIIVVDNGSRDDSVKFIKRYYKNVKVLLNNINNYCAACNLGMLKSEGDWVVLLNNDVEVKKDWLRKLVNTALRDNRIGGIASTLLNYDGTIQNAGLSMLSDFYWDERGSGKKVTKYNYITELDAISGACAMYRKEALKQAGFLDEDFVMFGEDVDISMRLKKKGWKLIHAPSSKAYHKKHGSCSESFARESIEKNRLLLVAKHYPERLAGALVGNKYFIAKKAGEKSGRFFNILPDIFVKLVKEHGQLAADKITRDVFTELEKILNYESKKLEEEIKNLLGDLIGTRKDRDEIYKDRECYKKQKIEYEKYKKEEEGIIVNKSRQVEELSQKLNSINQELRHHKEEIARISDILREKDLNIEGKNQHIGKLLENLDSMRNELLVSKEEISNLSDKLKESDRQLEDKKQHIEKLLENLSSVHAKVQEHREEVSNLSNKLKESLDQMSQKDSAIKHKDDAITERNNKVAELSSQLNSMNNELQHRRDEIKTVNNDLQHHRDEIVRIADILREKDLNIEGKNQHIGKLLESIDSVRNELFARKEEISGLSEKLKTSLEEGLCKDRFVAEKELHIKELSQKLNSINLELQHNKEDISSLSDKLKESEYHIENKQQYIEKLSENLSSISEELSSYKEEVSNLSGKLKTSLDDGLRKDGVIMEQDSAIAEKENSIIEKLRRIEELSKNLSSISEELSSYKEEVSNLSGKLKTSLDDGLRKDGVIYDKSRDLEIMWNELTKVRKELSGIHHSKGFRFVLNPLWKIIGYSRVILKQLLSKAYSFIWSAIILFLSPVILLHALALAFEHIIEALFGNISLHFKKKRDVVPFEKLTISVVIPNWNGIDLLEKCLSSIYEADEFKEDKHEVLVVDDASKYNIADLIKDSFPKTRVIRNSRNMGFGRTCNRGIKEAKGELIVLLNNDIMVSKDFLGPLKAHFKNPEVFAVSPKLYYWDMKTFNYGMHMGKFKDGYLSLWNEAETGNGDRVSQAVPTIFAVGGAMCFRKRDFLWLGGFDDIYRPNCWEDIDISYRAQKRGLKVLYEPKSLVYHKGAATLNYVRHKEIKNELLFMWKNLNDSHMLWSHLNQIPKFLYCGKHSSRITFLIGYLRAFNHIVPAMINRFREKKYAKTSDKKILNRSMLYYRNLMRNNYVHPDKKTILLITPFMIYPLNSGGKLRIYNLYKRLSEKYNIILLSLIHDEKEAEYAGHIKGIFKEIHVIHPKTVNNNFLFPRRYKYSYSSFLIEKLKKIQEKSPIDLVHIESNEMLYLADAVKYAPVVYTEHDISMLSYHRSYYKKGISDSLPDFIDYLKVVNQHNSAYSKLDKIIALSKEDENIIKAFAPKADYSLIPTGVDLEHFKFKEKSGKNKSLIFVGHYPHYPNEEAASYFCKDIFPIIKKAVPEAVLKLVGSGPTENIIKLSKIEGVHVTGTVQDVNPHLQDASIFICPFKSSAGIKGKVLEAMATGTPVVCTTRGSYGIDAVHGLNILIANNPNDFAENVMELLRNEELYKKLARNARTLVDKKYDWNKIAKQLDRVYADITESGFEADQGVPDTIAPDKENALSSSDMLCVRDIIEKTDKVIELSLDYRNKDGLEKTGLKPEELHIELTHSCNSRCITCDIWDYHQRNNKSASEELTLDEIKDLVNNSKRLKEIKTVVLSGGEPFLRNDIVDICVFIKEALPQASLGILTNGMKTETILNRTKDILKIFRNNSLWIGSSLDGMGDVYDKIRGVKGGFDNFARTMNRFKKELPDVRLSATFVLTPFNADQLIPCWEFADSHGLDFFAQFGVPKQPRSPETFQWKEGDFISIKNDIARIIQREISKTSDLERFSNSFEKTSDKINLLTKIYYWSHLVDFQKTGKRFAYNCDAAFKFAMFDPYGNMFFCPLLKEKAIGNIREENFDDLWVSDKANKIRDFIKGSKCSCWLVCTVFPIVGESLALHGDKAAMDLFRDNKVRSRIDVISNNISNVELNNAEFKDKRIALQSLPQGITIGANYKCNASCVFCLEGEYKPFSLNLYRNYFEARLNEMIKKTDYISFCGMGEVLLVPGVKNFLEHINTTLPDKNKIFTTNGIALKEGLADIFTASKYSIQISMHASNAKLHEHITGLKGGFDKIVEHIRYIAARRTSKEAPCITLVFLANTMNIEDLPNFIELASFLGVDCVQCNYMTIFKQAHLKLSCFFMQQITNEMFDKAERLAKELNITLRLPPRFAADSYFKTRCSDPWKSIYVDTEGAVLPCCYSGEHFGELRNSDILSIWNNPKYQQIRTDLASENAVKMCKFCLNSNPANVNLLNSHVSFRPDVQKLVLN